MPFNLVSSGKGSYYFSSPTTMISPIQHDKDSIVCERVPLRRTRSFTVRPLFRNFVLSTSIESLTSGMSSASEIFETNPSLLPVGT